MSRNVLNPQQWLPKTSVPALDNAAMQAVNTLAQAGMSRLNPAAQQVVGTIWQALEAQGASTGIKSNPGKGASDGELGTDKAKFMRDLAKLPSGVVALLGRKGSGKSVLSFVLGTMYHRQGRPIFVVGVKQSLLSPLGFRELNADAIDTIPKNSVVIVDDAGQAFASSEYQKDGAKRLQKFLIVTRHKTALLIWNNINSSLVNRHLVDSDVFFFKPRSRIGRKLERDELQELLVEAETAFSRIPFDQQKTKAYAYSEVLNYHGMISYGLPPKWSEKLSKNKA